ncbi:MAG: helix-turn-helix domain-containing protein [Reyranellaceae bacterium]
MDGPGRPTLYCEEFAEQAHRLCLMGAINDDLARAFEVSTRTIENWLRSQPVFREAVRRGREMADGDVAHGLYRRAVGYTYLANKVLATEGEAVTVPYEVHCLPDTRAAIFWLRNRQPRRWRNPPADAPTEAGRNWWPGAEDSAPAGDEPGTDSPA